MYQNHDLRQTAPSIWIVVQIALTLLTIPLWASARPNCEEFITPLPSEGATLQKAKPEFPCRAKLRLSQDPSSGGTGAADPSAPDPELITSPAEGPRCGDCRSDLRKEP